MRRSEHVEAGRKLNGLRSKLRVTTRNIEDKEQEMDMGRSHHA